MRLQCNMCLCPVIKKSDGFIETVVNQETKDLISRDHSPQVWDRNGLRDSYLDQVMVGTFRREEKQILKFEIKNK